MFPTIPQRLFIMVGLTACGLLYLRAAPAAGPADGARGVVLLEAARPAAAIGLFIVLTIPAVIIGAAVAAVGNPLTGVFCVAAGLMFPAVRGGSIDNWVRGVSSSSDFWGLAGESAVWMGIIAAAALGSVTIAARIRRGLPASWRSDGAAPREASPMSRTSQQVPAIFHVPLSMAMSALLGGLIAPLLMQSPDAWQVIWSIFIAFSVGGLITHQLFPVRNPVGILLSPLLAAVVWYSVAAMNGGSAHHVLAAYFGRTFWHAVMALPIVYASAGVAGAAVGIGWSQGFSLVDGSAEEPAREAGI